MGKARDIQRQAMRDRGRLSLKVVLAPGSFPVPTAVPEVVLNFLSLDFHVPC